MDFEGELDSLLYAIEVSDSMLEQIDGKSNLQRALDAALESLRLAMLASPKSSVGVLFYGCQGHEQLLYKFLPLAQQDSGAVKNLARLASDSSYLQSLLQPHPYNLGDVFFAAGQEFEKDPKKSLRRLVIVTDNDNPHKDDSRRAHVAETKCNDLVDKSVTITPIFISSEERPFVITNFWDNLHYAPSGVSIELDKTVVQPTSITASVISRSMPKRSVFNIPLSLNNALVAQVKGYNLFIPRKVPVPKPVYTQGDKQQVPETKSVLIVQQSGKEVPQEECKRAFKFGSELLPPPSEEEMNSLRSFGEPRINVIATMDKNDFKFLRHTKHSIFIYPSEETFTGSTRGFVSLWQSLLKKNKYAVCTAVLRNNVTPVVGVLIPTVTEYYTDFPNVQSAPGGLHLVTLPFVDDFRVLAKSEIQEKGTDLQRQRMDAIVDKLTMSRGYNPARFHNPALAWMDEVIEATALSRRMPETPVDNTKPKYNSIEQRAGSAIADFKRALTESRGEPRRRGDDNAEDD